MPTQSGRLWQRFVRVPFIVFLLLAGVFACTDADLAIARAFFFDESRGEWIGAHNWWIETVVHTGGRWAIRVVVACAIGLWLASFTGPRMRGLRRAAGFFVIACVLSIGIVGLLKTLTNVDCPWDLTPFGGKFPLVALFADRPDALRAARCFPAAHASSGYALIALYFASLDRSSSLSKLGLVVGIVCGLVFGLAQQSRGAHFVSHDLWSAFMVWAITAAVYVFGFRASLYAPTIVKVIDETTREDCGDWVRDERSDRVRAQ